eukprot:scaffold10488_cov67-Cyclotella_meneghiniana.AAC.13
MSVQRAISVDGSCGWYFISALFQTECLKWSASNGVSQMSAQNRVLQTECLKCGASNECTKWIVSSRRACDCLKWIGCI